MPQILRIWKRGLGKEERQKENKRGSESVQVNAINELKLIVLKLSKHLAYFISSNPVLRNDLNVFISLLIVPFTSLFMSTTTKKPFNFALKLELNFFELFLNWEIWSPLKWILFECEKCIRFTKRNTNRIMAKTIDKRRFLHSFTCFFLFFKLFTQTSVNSNRK